MFITNDWFGTFRAPLGEFLSIAVTAVGLIILGGEGMSSQLLFTAVASEAFFMIRVAFVVNAPGFDHLRYSFYNPGCGLYTMTSA